MDTQKNDSTGVIRALQIVCCQALHRLCAHCSRQRQWTLCSPGIAQTGQKRTSCIWNRLSLGDMCNSCGLMTLPQQYTLDKTEPSWHLSNNCHALVQLLNDTPRQNRQHDCRWQRHVFPLATRTAHRTHWLTAPQRPAHLNWGTEARTSQSCHAASMCPAPNNPDQHKHLKRVHAMFSSMCNHTT